MHVMTGVALQIGQQAIGDKAIRVPCVVHAERFSFATSRLTL